MVQMHDQHSTHSLLYCICGFIATKAEPMFALWRSLGVISQELVYESKFTWRHAAGVAESVYWQRSPPALRGEYTATPLIAAFSHSVADKWAIEREKKRKGKTHPLTCSLEDQMHSNLRLLRRSLQRRKKKKDILTYLHYSFWNILRAEKSSELEAAQSVTWGHSRPRTASLRGRSACLLRRPAAWEITVQDDFYLLYVI